ncbi:MFS transporter [Actinocatenispora rupis]|uniref:MFS transporter n=1 Tax=Actinocatenispora rupis TaxID=519421 RepID=UPI0019456517|nr:MFS transporter [Actinocatenispora rupis]
MRVAGPGFFALGYLARLPYAMTTLATLMLLQAATGSYAFAGLAAGAQGVAVTVGGPAVGTLADRLGHRAVLVAVPVADLAAVGLLLAATGLGRAAMLAAAVLVGLTQPQVGPLVRVRWSRLLRARGVPGLVPTALSYEAAADETSFVLGPALVGLLTPLPGPFGTATAPTAGVGLLLAAATVPFAARYCRPARPGPAHAEAGGGRLRRRALGGMVVAMVSMGAVFGAVQTGVTAYARDLAQPELAGLVYAEFGIGSALAGAACAWLPSAFTLRRRYLVFAGALLAGTVCLAAGARLGAVEVAVAVASVTVAPYMTCLYALTEQLAPPSRATTAMTVLCAGGPLGTAAGQALAGVLAERYGAAGAFAAAPLAAGIALLLAVALLLADRGRGVWVAGRRPAATRSVPPDA